jgi:hypothetical protein
MSLFSDITNLKVQIIETQAMLEKVLDHPLMSESLEVRLNYLRQKLDSLPKVSYEPKIKLLFSGNAVIGSSGIKSSFLSKTLAPFQEMIKTQFAVVRFGKAKGLGKMRIGPNSDLYLTALPIGSFGIELTQLDTNDLFDSMDISKAMKEIMILISNTAKDDETFESSIENTPKKNLLNIKKFFHEIMDESSDLKMESGELGVELSKEKVTEGYNRISATKEQVNERIINGTFRGLLLDSGKFEVQDEEGIKLSGFISEQLSEAQLVDYDKMFLNANCKIHLNVYNIEFKTGVQKTSYELLEIKGM